MFQLDLCVNFVSVKRKTEDGDEPGTYPKPAEDKDEP